MKKQFFFAAFILLYVQLHAQLIPFEYQLYELPDVIFQRIEAPVGFEAAYELRVRQPLDHKNPDAGHFYQKVFLSHRSEDRPTVIVTEGYDRAKNRIYELTDLLKANQIDVEHRYYGESMPDKLDYSYLNLEQAAADLHHINELFKKIYQGKWLSTGISKGGQTTIFYRYFYPEDVDVSVPYVAPLNLEFEEKRIYTFLDTIGTDECRANILAVQKRLLKDRKQVLPMLRWYARGANLQFSYHTLEQAFELAVLEYPFSFWQWGHDCDMIPDPQAPTEEILEHLLDVSGVDFFSDKDIYHYSSHYYQAASEMGYYGYETKKFKGLLKALSMSPNPHAAFTPMKMKVSYDGSLTHKVNDWLAENGDRFIYINGAIDTWSATAVRPSEGIDALWFFLKGKDHARARIANMNEDELAKLIDALEKWLEMDIENIFSEK